MYFINLIFELISAQWRADGERRQDDNRATTVHRLFKINATDCTTICDAIIRKSEK